MRAIEITLFLIFVIAGIALIPSLLPTYGALPTGNADVNLTSKMNLTMLEAKKPAADAGIIDQASYFFNLAVTSVYSSADFLFSIVSLVPALAEIFHINPVLLGIFGVGVFCLGIIAWIQFTKGDSFEGKR